MSNEKLVRKVLRTLPKEFAYKVTAIEEAQDLTTMSVDELIGNLTMLEMSLDDGESNKKKGIALRTSSDEDLVETMNISNNRWKKPVKPGNYGVGQSDGSKGIQCRDSEGFRHIQVECPNYIKKQSNNFSSTLSDDESHDGQEDPISNFVAFTDVTKPTITDTVDDNNEDEEDMTEKEFLEDYKLLYTKWMELTVLYTKVELKGAI
ncbi:hypothetical protein LIER_39732 [Lithospermum erythrorhizon]|uniref:Gag-pol polyprotein n=1 Tax=Lithospermum erythrorhizon TaxID=34254 RepID=A0AAV3QMD7_LITER